MPGIWIGPVNFDIYNGDASWTSNADDMGFRGMALSGGMLIKEAKMLQELTNKPTSHRISLGDHSGVLDYVWFDTGFMRDFNGWYLMKSVDVNADRASGPGEYVHFNLTCVLVPSQRVVVSRSARKRANDWGLGQTAILAQPFWNDLDGGNAFEVYPGGDSFFREYDPRTGWHTTGTPGRQLQLYEGTFS